MKIIFLAYLLSLVACSHLETNEKSRLQQNEVNFLVSSEKYLLLQKILAQEMAYIDSIPEKDFQSEIKNLLKVITIISFEKNSCTFGQVACSDQSHEGVIFINSNFFLMPELEQFTTILHEAVHLQKNNFEHAKCSKVLAWGYECDEQVNSPYGIEYKYFLHKYMHTKDESITQLLLKTFNRINKI